MASPHMMAAGLFSMTILYIFYIPSKGHFFFGNLLTKFRPRTPRLLSKYLFSSLFPVSFQCQPLITVVAILGHLTKPSKN